MRRTLRVALLVVAAAAFAAGYVSPASTSPKQASRASVIPLLRIGATITFSTLDPAKNAGTGGLFYGPLERLFGFRPDGSLQPQLATSVTPDRVFGVTVIRSAR